MRQSIDSVLGQTFSDIELICVDDCSTDNSVAIIEEYGKLDSRVKLLRHEENLRPLKSRIDGVIAARGQYILFLDSDDELVRYACEKLHNITKQRQADIYGFGTEVDCPDPFAKQQVQSYFKTYNGELYGRDILQKSFVNRDFNRNIWDKMYDAQLCKKAFEMIREDCQDQIWFSVSADSFGFLYIAYYAESFFGVSETFYRYFYGRGSMGSEILSLDRFEAYCASAIDADKFHEFFAKRGVLEQYKQVIDTFRTEMLNICTGAWCYQIAGENKSEALKVMMRYWPPTDLVEWLISIWNENCSLKHENHSLKHDNYSLKNEKSWEVPFSLLPKGGRIVLYGAGDIGQDFNRQILASGVCEITLWVDKNYSSFRDAEFPVRSPDEIPRTVFDCILIAIRDYKTACTVKQFLLSLNVLESAIIWRDPSMLAREGI